MQREILFRGQLSHSKTWVEGNLITDRNWNKYIIPFDVFEPDGHHLIIDSDNSFKVDEETVGQFAGMTDKNGKKIFEGDILLYEDWVPDYSENGNGEESTPNNGDVFWNEEIIGFDVRNRLSIDVSEIEFKETEVIGNIHDNKELLK